MTENPSVLKIQESLRYSKMARKLAGLSRNGPQERSKEIETDFPAKPDQSDQL